MRRQNDHVAVPLFDATNGPVLLITGGSVRVGRVISQYLHQQGYRLCIHYRHSEQAALQWVAELNAQRPHSATAVSADLCNMASVTAMLTTVMNDWGRLDGIINNASSFYPTPLPTATAEQWDDLMGSNVKGAFFLCQAAAAELTKQEGQIINIADIHGQHPLRRHSIYSMAKAALIMMTKSLAQELAPKVRVNAVAPGAVLWPEDLSEEHRQMILERTALQRPGSPLDVAQAINYLLQARFVTGQVIAVEGGRYF